MIGGGLRCPAPREKNNMNRCVGSAFGSLSLGLLASTALAQTAAPDFSKVEIKTHQVAGNFYYLEGQGGNIGVLIGD
ncbi:MAG TPA: hypothetical protein VMV37_10495, partial [Gammaproteobacteria bacterium]|nr:hypothetical protein [Gammaproteobacteria bacterium]